MRSRSEADALCQTLLEKLGLLWRGEVWENLGWHYSAELGGLSIREYEEKEGCYRYTAYLNEEGHGGGLWVGGGRTPREAIDHVFSQAIDEVDRKLRIIEAAKRALGERPARQILSSMDVIFPERRSRP